MSVTEYIEGIIDLVQDRSKRVSVDGLLEKLSEQAVKLPDFSLFVRQKKFFNEADDLLSAVDYLLLNYLSFSVKSGELIRFDAPRPCTDEYIRLSPYCVYETPNIYIAADDPEIESRIGDLVLIAELMTMMFYSHVYDEMVSASANRLKHELSSGEGAYELDRLLEYLSESYAVDGLTSFQFSCDRGGGCPAIDSYRDFGVSSEGFLERIGDRILYSAQRGRITDGFIRNSTGVSINYTIIPASGQNWKAVRGDGVGLCILVFGVGREVDEFLVRFAKVGAKGATVADHEAQLRALQTLDRAKRRLLREIRVGRLRTPPERDAYVGNVIAEILEQIYHSTKSHSVTFRRYNPFENVLVKIGECAFQSGQYRWDFGGSIPIENRLSNNVRCFEECGPSEYIYVPDLFSQSDQNEDCQSKYFNPRQSSSEICFPVWKSGVPIGTINAESPLRNAFARDITFLDSIARQLGDFISTAMDAVPPPTRLRRFRRQTNLRTAHWQGRSLRLRRASITNYQLPLGLRSISG